VQYQVSRPHKTTGQTVILCILIYIFREETVKQKVLNQV
jgi:hypothetical protein